MLKTMPVYDRKIKAAIYPWADKLHTIVGLVYIHDDKEKEDFLVYMYPQEGEMVALIHKTKATITNAVIGVKLNTEPDPTTDERLDSINLS